MRDVRPPHVRESNPNPSMPIRSLVIPTGIGRDTNPCPPVNPSQTVRLKIYTQKGFLHSLNLSFWAPLFGFEAPRKDFQWSEI